MSKVRPADGLRFLFISQPKRTTAAVAATATVLVSSGLALQRLAGENAPVEYGLLLLPALLIGFFFGPALGVVGAIAAGVLVPAAPDGYDLGLRLASYGTTAGLAGVLGVLTHRKTRRLESAIDRLARDSEERRQAAERLRWQSLAVTNIGEGVCITDQNGVVLFANPALGQMLGYEAGELLGQPVSRLYPGGADNATFRAIMEGLRAGHWSGEAALLTRNGSSIPTIETASAVRDELGVVIGYVCINADLRERERSRAALQRLSDRLGHALQVSRMALWEWDLTTNEVTWTGADERLEGALPKAFAGDSVALEAVEPEDRNRVATALRRALTLAEPFQVEFRLRRPDGSVIWVDAKAEVVFDQQTKPARMVGGAIDVTRRKLVEEELGKQMREREALASIAIAVSGHPTIQAGFDVLVKELGNRMPVDQASLVLLSADRGMLEVIASTTDSGPFAVGNMYGLDQCASSQALREKRTLLRRDLREEAVFEADRHAIAAGFRSHVVAPVILGKHWYGSIHIAHHEPGMYSSGDADFLGAVAQQVAAHLQRGNLHEALSAELRRGRQRIEAFQSAAAKLVLEEDVDAALSKLIDTARRVIGGEFCLVAVWNAQGEVTRCAVAGAAPGATPSDSTPQSCQQLADLFRDMRQSCRLVDVSSRRELRTELQFRLVSGSFVAAPILMKATTVGVLYLRGKEGGTEFSDDDERLLNLFAVVCGVLLRNAELYGIVTDKQKTLSTIVTNMAEGLVVLDQAGRIRVWNDAVTRITGVSEKEVLGKSVPEVMAVRTHMPDSTGATGAVLGVLSGDAAGRSTELVLEHPRWQVLEARPFQARLESQKALAGLLLRDVTRERELERRRDAFVSIASHELRTPMTTVLGFTELLLKRRVPEDTKREWLLSIYEDSRRLTAIIDDLLNVSRLQSGKIPVKLQSVPVEVVVREVLRVVTPTTDRHRFVVDMPADVPEVWGDREKVGQVLMNLLTNAVKYSPDGGEVTVCARHVPSERRVVVGVRDQGIGIAPADQGELFTSFHRVRRAETEAIRGTGLGLYIVKALVELMNGEVWVQSDPGKGSTFSFTLPVRPANTPNRGGGDEMVVIRRLR